MQLATLVAEDEDDVLFTIERPGLDCGICAKPCLACPACLACCSEEAIMHGGRVIGPAGNVAAPKPLVMMRQGQAFESPFNPKVNISTLGGSEESKPHFSVTGPFVFGERM